MDSHLCAHSIPLVGGVLDGGTWCGVVGVPGVWGKGVYTLRQSV